MHILSSANKVGVIIGMGLSICSYVYPSVHQTLVVSVHLLLGGLTSNLVGTFIITLPKAWLTDCPAPLNFCCFLAYDWLIGFRSFADKALIALSSTLVGQLIMGLTWPDWLMVMLCWIAAISWSLIGHAVSGHLQTNGWSHWAQIWWAKNCIDYTNFNKPSYLAFVNSYMCLRIAKYTRHFMACMTSNWLFQYTVVPSKCNNKVPLFKGGCLLAWHSIFLTMHCNKSFGVKFSFARVCKWVFTPRP